ncbi:MAG TPA: DUF5343 domain-containing protein [Candidatus Hydrogenedentes bacterium]|nr:DUF5343 domain-containing protein [Candidatus Hydrogenedentota bacterium]HQH51366.1 DUF5343 domain-containing protein [Candidatus Hydrogenedentota bacterium]
MSVGLPYLAAPTNISKALEKIRTAPTPPKVTQDFVKTKLQIPSSSGNQMTAYLKRIGLVAADGSPSELYTQYRNQKTAGVAIAKAIRIAYAPIYEHNEYAHDLSDEDLRGLIVQVTGWAEDARSVDLTLKCISLLKAQATFDAGEDVTKAQETEQERSIHVAQSSVPALVPQTPQRSDAPHKRMGMNLSYTINLNLPPSTDIAVFNAIFKSLKENLLKDIDENAG